MENLNPLTFHIYTQYLQLLVTSNSSEMWAIWHITPLAQNKKTRPLELTLKSINEPHYLKDQVVFEDIFASAVLFSLGNSFALLRLKTTLCRSPTTATVRGPVITFAPPNWCIYPGKTLEKAFNVFLSSAAQLKAPRAWPPETGSGVNTLSGVIDHTKTYW